MIKLFDNLEWILSGIGIAAIGLLWRYVKKVKEKHTYYWKPTSPMVNPTVTRKIDSYPQNPRFDFEKGEFSSEFVSGKDSFLLMIQKFILTERYEYQIYSENYGIEETHSIFVTKNKEEFERQCSNIANQLIKSYSDWIQEIYAISRKRDKLLIEMKVKGKPETLKCIVPNIYKKQVIYNEVKI